METAAAICDCEIYIRAIYGLLGVVGGLFGWLMKAKTDHFHDLKESIAEARKRAEGAA